MIESPPSDSTCMKVVNRDQANIIRTRHGSELRPLIDRTSSAASQCSLAEEMLPPGHAVTPHHHRLLEEIYYIVEGRGTMIIDDERHPVAAGDAIFVPRGSRHSLENTGSVAIRLIVACGPAFFYEDEIFEAGDEPRPPELDRHE